jgi:hypothetical protein
MQFGSALEPRQSALSKNGLAASNQEKYLGRDY